MQTWLTQTATHRQVRVLVIASILTVVLTVAGIQLAPRFYLSDGERPAATTVPLASFYPPNIAEQTLISPCDGLARIDVWLSSPLESRYARAALQTGDRETLGTAEFLVSSGEQTRHSLIFPGIADSAEQNFRLIWQGQGFPLALKVSPTDVYRQGALSISGTPTSSDLDMVLYYRPPTLRAWACVLSARIHTAWAPVDQLLVRMSQYKPKYFKKDGLIVLGAASLVALLLLIASLPSRASQPERNLGTQLLLAGLMGMGLLAALTVWFLAQDRIWLSDNTIRLSSEGTPPGAGEGRRITDDLLLALEKPGTQIAALEDWYVGVKWLNVRGCRPVLWMHPPSRISFTVAVPQEAELTFGVGVDSKVWEKQESDGVEFEIVVATAKTIEQVYWRAVDPRHDPGDQRWFDEQIDLSSYAGQEVAITLITYPRKNNSWDWAGWSHPIIIGFP
jgi:hypothetical protein